MANRGHDTGAASGPSAYIDRRREMMMTAPVERLVLRMAAPTVTTMLISALYNMADTYFVGRLGTSATAAVGVAFPLMAIVQAFGFFFGQGSGALAVPLHMSMAKDMTATKETG